MKTKIKEFCIRKTAYKTEQGMLRVLALALSLLALVAFSGCKLEDKLTDLFSTVSKETEEAYENVKTEVETTSSAVEDKINKISEAAEDIGEATEAVSEAIDSVQAINDQATDTATGTTAE